MTTEEAFKKLINNEFEVADDYNEYMSEKRKTLWTEEYLQSRKDALLYTASSNSLSKINSLSETIKRHRLPFFLALKNKCPNSMDVAFPIGRMKKFTHYSYETLERWLKPEVRAFASENGLSSSSSSKLLILSISSILYNLPITSTSHHTKSHLIDLYTHLYTNSSQKGEMPSIDMKEHDVQRSIQLAEDLGMILHVDDQYTYCSESTLERYINTDFVGYTKVYFCNKDRINEICHELCLSFLATISITLDVLIDINNDVLNSICNSSVYDVDKYDNMCDDSEVRRSLTDLLREFNSYLPDAECFHDLKGRAYSDICSVPSYQKAMDLGKEWTHGMYSREHYLDEVFGAGQWKEFDRRGSIYNLSYLLCTGDYLPNDVDIYAEKINCKEFSDKRERLILKFFMMTMYFKDIRTVTSWPGRWNSLINKTKNGCKLNKADIEYRDMFTSITGINEGDTNKDVVGRFTKWFKEKEENFDKACGNGNKTLGRKNRKSLKDKIFIYESLLYAMFCKKLRDMGIRVVQVYDSVAINKDIPTNLLEETLKEVCLDFYNKYKI